MRKRVFVLLGSLLIFSVAGFLLFRDSPTSLARSKFDQIEIGMTRQQVRDLMDDGPTCASLGCIDSYGFEDQSDMWIIFEPDYCFQGNTEGDEDPEYWKVSNVIAWEERMTNRKLLIRLGLSSGSWELTKP